MLAIIFKLLIGHALADFALQPNAMAMGKNRKNSGADPAGKQKRVLFWPYWQTAHGLIHGGAVWYATGSLAFGIAETALHWIIDFAKGENRIGPHADQLLHVICKAAYVALIFLFKNGV